MDSIPNKLMGSASPTAMYIAEGSNQSAEPEQGHITDENLEREFPFTSLTRLPAQAESIQTRGARPPPRTGLLEGYLTREELASDLEVHWRSIVRYEREPDGLPSIMIGGRKYYRIEAVRDWLARREVHPNPTRAAETRSTKPAGARVRCARHLASLRSTPCRGGRERNRHESPQELGG